MILPRIIEFGAGVGLAIFTVIETLITFMFLFIMTAVISPLFLAWWLFQKLRGKPVPSLREMAEEPGDWEE